MPYWMAGSVLVVVFSLALPVPINNRLTNGERRSIAGDVYHWLRTCALVVAFVMLFLSVGVL